MVSADFDLFGLFLHFLDKEQYVVGYILLYYIKHLQHKELDRRLKILEADLYFRKDIPMEITKMPCAPSNFRVGRKYYLSWSTITPYIVGREAQVDKIIYHWINGSLAVADGAFGRDGTQVSAHYGVEDTTIHQYVDVKNTSYNCGNGKANCESISIEHSAQPGRDATDATYETSARLVASIAKAQGKRVQDFQHLPHKKFVATACPGTIDIGRIVARANEIEALVGVDQSVAPVSVQAIEAVAPITQPVVTRVPVTQTFWATVTVPQLRVRTAPDTNAPAVDSKLLVKGNTVECFEVVTGSDPYGDGRNLWLHTEVSKLYIWAGGTKYNLPTNQV